MPEPRGTRISGQVDAADAARDRRRRHGRIDGRERDCRARLFRVPDDGCTSPATPPDDGARRRAPLTPRAGIARVGEAVSPEIGFDALVVDGLVETIPQRDRSAGNGRDVDPLLAE